ncbi:hypothetical protein QYE76_011349 [Lolium multiflorum]|uniref:Uncharacterized protein n=1 Tax=Lolium multiflorum TaxID=4521 RepID=A0AAD8X571_LOLMU|nr:hypothetical protein QYE76_011349 [Lolium multiflorum]
MEAAMELAAACSSPETAATTELAAAESTTSLSIHLFVTLVAVEMLYVAVELLYVELLAVEVEVLMAVEMLVAVKMLYVELLAAVVLEEALPWS